MGHCDETRLGSPMNRRCELEKLFTIAIHDESYCIESAQEERTSLNFSKFHSCDSPGQ